jgi:UPF0755 protein
MTLIVVLILLAGFLFYFYQSKLNYRSSTDDEFAFEIKPGESTDNIIDSLILEGFVGEKYIWQIYLRLNPTLGDGIQAGDFLLNKNMSIPDVIQAIQKANIKKGIKITIPEGLRYDEQAEIFDAGFAGTPKNAFLKADFLKIAEDPGTATFSTEVATFLARNHPQGKTMEGYLFPETYFFEEGSTAQGVIEKMVLTLSKKISEEDYQTIYSSKYTFHDHLTVASLIERETLALSDKDMVADIIYKRLENGINGVKLLQLDATMLYVIKDWKAYNKINESLKEKYKNDPYNTFRVAGLPPTPICSPGLTSIKAAIYPQKNEYYFYIHDENGVIHYGKTLSEHNANIREYL